MEPRVAIIGAGSFGQALAFVFQEREDVLVELWDKDPAKVPGQRSLPEVASAASLLLLCVPSRAVREALEAIRDHVDPETIVISTTKGIDAQRLTCDQLLEMVLLMGQPYGLLSGPMLAAEMQAGQVAFAALAGNGRDIFERVREVMAGTSVRLEYSDDLHGVALAGVLKNVYAIGLGMAQAMNFGHNVRGSLVMQACREMGDVIASLGGRRETAWGLSGLADLVATGFSDSSRNCQAGQELVRTGRCVTISEGVESLPHLKALVGDVLVSYPVLAAIDAVVAGEMSAPAALGKLLAVRFERQKARI